VIVEVKVIDDLAVLEPLDQHAVTLNALPVGA